MNDIEMHARRFINLTIFINSSEFKYLSPASALRIKNRVSFHHRKLTMAIFNFYELIVGLIDEVFQLISSAFKGIINTLNNIDWSDYQWE